MSASESVRSGTRFDYRLNHQQFSIAALMSKKEDVQSASGKVILSLNLLLFNQKLVKLG
jgi:hypothetical protein